MQSEDCKCDPIIYNFFVVRYRFFCTADCESFLSYLVLVCLPASLYFCSSHCVPVGPVPSGQHCVTVREPAGLLEGSTFYIS